MAVLQEIKSLLERAAREMGTPSVSIGIIQDGKATFASTGVRDIKTKLAPDKDTVYAIGSASKAFTAAAIAMLADEGKIDFETPVRAYIPGFEMYDSYVTENLTVGDTLCHRCGLPRHEFMWYLNLAEYSLKDHVDRLKYLKPNKTFRTDMQYQNHMFMLAGYLIEKVSGQTWAQFVSERIFKPLGMADSSCDEAGYFSHENRATPYYISKQGETIELPFKNIDKIGPAGSINSTAADMMKWLQFNLDKGKISDTQLISEKNLTKCHTPQMIVNGERVSKFEEIKFQNYGYGWFVEAYKGVPTMQHGGSIDGFLAGATFIPSINTGIMILTNHDNAVTPTAVRYGLYDILLDLERSDWVGRIKAEQSRVNIAGQTLEDVPMTLELIDAAPTHEIGEYAGIYEHPAYGVYDIKCDNGVLKMSKGGFDVSFKHTVYDNFSMDICEARDLVVPCKFDYGAKGVINALKIDYEAESIIFVKK